MPLNPDAQGQTFVTSQTYLVGREKLREFARAVGETSSVCHDVAAARSAGYSDVVASVTFAIAITLEIVGDFVTDPKVGLDWSRVVHGEQRFSSLRPIVAGDELSVATEIESIKSMAGNDMISVRSDLSALDGTLISQVWTTLVARGEQP
jgi:acyl dehydratase